MKKYSNGKYIDLTEEEEAEWEAKRKELEESEQLFGGGGVNLHNPETDVDNAYISTKNGNLENYTGWYATEFISVYPGYVRISGTFNGTLNYCAMYGSDKSFVCSFTCTVSKADQNLSKSILRIPPDAAYLRFSSGNREQINRLEVYQG